MDYGAWKLEEITFIAMRQTHEFHYYYPWACSHQPTGHGSIIYGLCNGISLFEFVFIDFTEFG